MMRPCPPPAAVTEPTALAVTRKAVCATVAFPVTSVVVVNRVMPSMRYTINNCGTRKLNTIVTVYEVFGQMSEICPAPMPAPARLTISSGRTVTSSVRTSRGACGFVSPLQQTIVPSSTAWQAHRLMVSVRNAADNTLLSTTASPFTWHGRRTLSSSPARRAR
ncbi:MAG: hypothetical protein IT355_05830 [Gemmatimonadaceae bacterium]|nr:hypothetical protein [Gemmatimonadaceae bacterium]